MYFVISFRLPMFRKHRRVVRTTAWYTFSLVVRLIPLLSHTFERSLPNAALPLAALLLISVSMLAEVVNVLPRYVKLSTDFRSCAFTEILGWMGGFPGAGWYITSVFLVEMVRFGFVLF